MKRALVTGASRGIGRAVTEMLLDAGWRVVRVARFDGAVGYGDFQSPRWPWDICKAPGIGVVDFWKTHPLDAVVHCAATRGPYGPLGDVDEDAWLQTVQTNLIGTYRVVKATLPALRQSDDGRMLLFSGGGAFGPSAGYSAYAAAKGGVVSLMETLAEELAGTNVSVNCVAPGFVATGIHDGTPHEGQPDRPYAMSDVVDCVRHLLSPATRGLSGRTISAQHDDWRGLSPLTVPSVMASRLGTRDRHAIQCLERAARHPTAVLV